VRLCAPEVAYTIANDDTEAARINVRKGERVNEERVADHVRRIYSRIKRHDTYTTITKQPDEVADYLAQRREARRTGKRR
jgi:hypothetical protein